MRNLLRKGIAVFAFAAMAMPVFAVDKNDGGITFPLVVDMTMPDGTAYSTDITIYNDSESAIYLRYEWAAAEGPSANYFYVHNPISGIASSQRGIMAFLRYATGLNVHGAGVLRVSPVDDQGRGLKNVQLSGFSRIFIKRPDGGITSERIQGIPDNRLPGLRAKNITPTILFPPHNNESRFIMISNLDDQTHTIGFSGGSGWFDSNRQERDWRFGDTITLEAGRSALVPIEDVPQEVLDSVDPWRGDPWNASIGINAACKDCKAGDAFTVTTVSINKLTMDPRIIMDVLSDR